MQFTNKKVTEKVNQIKETTVPYVKTTLELHSRQRKQKVHIIFFKYTRDLNKYNNYYESLQEISHRSSFGRGGHGQSMPAII